ncbi:MAG: bifunctional phosphopantothenoylcysteine decarboxylase/phosphopantothenate--cysteine ligase CoaBC [Actinomycetota bacterium]|jgi:phosphopantothenoylcysteine decarboxylase/phosphopantothenate--cysteine ligase|nr:bifunctional phosphopantothenoylcysteine decarboxylase/phosphopantothenate--cysteine ligase CoaBC [Actinomycetota bacterium]
MAEASDMNVDSTTADRPVVALGLTGCIAAYKACEIARALVKRGVRVIPLMTEAATRFVGPLTLRTLTGEQVASSLWEDPGTAQVHHISLAQEIDVFAIVPCTANVVAKLAHGRADDLLTTTALATEAPLVIAPAMNTHMWRAEATIENLNMLRSRGSVIVEPESGELACGDVGEGRLAPLEAIVEAIMAEVERAQDLAGVRMLVTAGPTREPIDAVRFIGNPSSGKTGYGVAQEAARRGAHVTLVSGPTELPDPFGCTTVRVSTAAEMLQATVEAYASCDVVVASAAVSDLRPVFVFEGKIKKSASPSSVELERTEDILAQMGQDKGERLLVGFAAETDNVLSYAREKLVAKNLDLIVANDVSVPEVGFGGDMNTVSIISADEVQELPHMSKRAVARVLLDRIAQMLGSGQ